MYSWVSNPQGRSGEEALQGLGSRGQNAFPVAQGACPASNPRPVQEHRNQVLGPQVAGMQVGTGQVEGFKHTLGQAVAVVEVPLAVSQ